jgi:hypothetical protein
MEAKRQPLGITLGMKTHEQKLLSLTNKNHEFAFMRKLNLIWAVLLFHESVKGS